MKQLTWLLTCGLVWSLSAEGLSLLFLGVFGPQDPALRENTQQQLYRKLQAIRGIEVISLDRTERIRHALYPERGHPDSEKKLRELARFAGDTSVIMWAYAKKPGVKPVRTHLFGSALNAHAGVSLIMYSLHDTAHIYHHDIVCSRMYPHAWLYLGPVNTMHIPAPRETALLRAIHDSLTAAVIDTVTRVCAGGFDEDNTFRGFSSRRGDGEKADVSDVFNVPSVGGRSLYEDTVADTTAQDTAGAPQ
jgi:hypothetical protein